MPLESEGPLPPLQSLHPQNSKPGLEEELQVELELPSPSSQAALWAVGPVAIGGASLTPWGGQLVQEAAPP